MKKNKPVVFYMWVAQRVLMDHMPHTWCSSDARIEFVSVHFFCGVKTPEPLLFGVQVENRQNLRRALVKAALNIPVVLF